MIYVTAARLAGPSRASRRAPSRRGIERGRITLACPCGLVVLGFCVVDGRLGPDRRRGRGASRL
jgi:hypothetical protein